jgi:hypothetical protein
MSWDGVHGRVENSASKAGEALWTTDGRKVTIGLSQLLPELQVNPMWHAACWQSRPQVAMLADYPSMMIGGGKQRRPSLADG